MPNKNNAKKNMAKNIVSKKNRVKKEQRRKRITSKKTSFTTMNEKETLKCKMY